MASGPTQASRVYTGGTFDCFHAGHVAFLRACAEYGEVWVGLNTDEFAARYKRKPIFSYGERYDVLWSCRYVTHVVENEGGEDSCPAILRAMPRYIAHGDDWTGPELMEQMGLRQSWLDEHGIEMLYIPYTKGISTTDLIERIRG